MRRGARAQGLVELAIVMPGVMLALMILLGLGVVLRADGGVAGVAVEAARSAALAPDATSARMAAGEQAASVARGYGLTNGTLEAGNGRHEQFSARRRGAHRGDVRPAGRPGSAGRLAGNYAPARGLCARGSEQDLPMMVVWHSTDRMMTGASMRRLASARAQGTVWFAFVVMVLVLMVGVLADGGLLFATYRRAALLADSAASAGAGVRGPRGAAG